MSVFYAQMYNLCIDLFLISHTDTCASKLAHKVCFAYSDHLINQLYMYALILTKSFFFKKERPTGNNYLHLGQVLGQVNQCNIC